MTEKRNDKNFCFYKKKSKVIDNCFYIYYSVVGFNGHLENIKLISNYVENKFKLNFFDKKSKKNLNNNEIIKQN